MKSSVYALIITLLLLLLTSQVVPACTCAPNPPPCEAFGRASAVFAGVVIGSAEQRRGNREGVTTAYDLGSIRFAVQGTFQGIDNKQGGNLRGTGGAARGS